MFDARPIRLPLLIAAWTLTLMLIGLPLLLVVTQAFASGVMHYFTVIGQLVTLDALNLTVLATVIAVAVDTVVGGLAAWVFTFYDFPGKKLLGALIDLPVAVSPVIGGLLLILTFSSSGWAYPLLNKLHWQIVYAKPAIFFATIFVSFPLVAQALLPVMTARGRQAEQAAAFMGASFFTIARDITFPAMRAPLQAGMVLAAARCLGEFGAVAVVSGNLPNQTLTLPLLIQTLYDEFKFTDAFAVATLLLATTAVIITLQHTLLERRL